MSLCAIFGYLELTNFIYTKFGCWLYQSQRGVSWVIKNIMKWCHECYCIFNNSHNDFNFSSESCGAGSTWCAWIFNYRPYIKTNCNTNGTWKEELNKNGLGWILRDANGQVFWFQGGYVWTWCSLCDLDAIIPGRMAESNKYPP